MMNENLLKATIFSRFFTKDFVNINLATFLFDLIFYFVLVIEMYQSESSS